MGNCFVSRRKTREVGPSDGVPGSGCIHIPLRVFPPQSEKEGQPLPLPTPSSEGDILLSPNLKPFTYYELKSATKNFYNLIGEGGFGCVYKGWLNLQTLAATKPGVGVIVAVKKLKPEGFQGHKEWLSEVRYLGQLHHPNLVKLIGYCLDGDKRLLVYEYMPKGSLENHLFRNGAEPLSWEIRMKVAIGAALGLSFLHDSDQQVIYRDFKASNILLDMDHNAKLSDFGLAKAGPTGDLTHVTTQVIGTHGYAAPEYIATGRLSSKCDVYSFGVVLLELLSGRRAVDSTKVGVERNLVDWAKPYLGDRRRMFRIMDIKLEGQYPQKGAFMAACLALECLGEAKSRPSMDDVVARLEKISVPKDARNRISKSDGIQPISIPSPMSTPRHHHRRPRSSSSSPANGTPTPLSPFATPKSPFATPVKSLLARTSHKE